MPTATIVDRVQRSVGGSHGVFAVGMSKDTERALHRRALELRGTLTDFGRAAGAGPGTITFATSVNTHGVIVGRSSAVAVRWTP
ncbi:hypothetical protein [Amycolatopsis sp. cmx-11-51]|uniref:hypothetical protein n=1 Tax=unclassified Amycolatopsis TaxID=2618356 RepID=UPI0039E5B9F8